MNKNLKTVLITIICIAAVQLLIYFNYKNYIHKEIVIPIEQNTQIQNNQFPFSMIEYNIQLGSKQMPDEITLDKTNLFNIKCYIKKENINFTINYKIQYLGLKNCGLSLVPITNTNANNEINAYNFIEFEPLQIIEFNTTASSIDQLKTIKPFITFLKDNASKIKTFSFMSLDDVAIPY